MFCIFFIFLGMLQKRKRVITFSSSFAIKIFRQNQKKFLSAQIIRYGQEIQSNFYNFSMYRVTQNSVYQYNVAIMSSKPKEKHS